MTLTESRDLLKETQKAQIRFLESCGLSRLQIGRDVCKYVGGAQVNNIMADRPDIMDGPHALLLSLECSSRGFDAGADIQSTSDKLTVPIAWAIDGDLSYEIREIMQGTGIAPNVYGRRCNGFAGDGR